MKIYIVKLLRHQYCWFINVAGYWINPNRKIQTVDSISRDMFKLPTNIIERAIVRTFFTGYVPWDMAVKKFNSIENGD